MFTGPPACVLSRKPQAIQASPEHRQFIRPRFTPFISFKYLKKRVNREQERKRREEGRGEGREVGGYYKHLIKRIEKIERIEGIQERVPLWVVNSNVHHELLLYRSHCPIHTHSHEETSSLKLHLIPNVLLMQHGHTLVSSIVSSCMKMFQVV